jgi:hypothetical protein
VEKPENPQEKKNKDKFKIVSLAVKAGVEYTPELVRRGNFDIGDLCHRNSSVAVCHLHSSILP